MNTSQHPVRFSVDYPERPLDRATTFFRLIIAIPILLLLATLSGGVGDWSYDNAAGIAGVAGMLFLAPLLMIVVRQKYPRWWFDWNLELHRFSNRVSTYMALMDDRYPATDEQQSVHLDYAYPDVKQDLNRWLPLAKWLLAMPHVVILIALNLAAVLAVVMSWVAILITGRYPRNLFTFVEGVLRWNNRVIGYAITLVTDVYPPFRLSA